MYNPESQTYNDNVRSFAYTQAVAKEFTFDYLSAQKMYGLFPEQIWKSIEDIAKGNWEFFASGDMSDSLSRLSLEIIKRFGEKFKLSFSRITQKHVAEKAEEWLVAREKATANTEGNVLFLSSNKHAGHEDEAIFKTL